jgi:hypothetical protein
MKAYWGCRYSSTHSLTSAVDGGEWSASLPAALPPGKESLVTIGWLGPGAGLDALVKRNIPSPCLLLKKISRILTNHNMKIIHVSLKKTFIHKDLYMTNWA